MLMSVCALVWNGAAREAVARRGDGMREDHAAPWAAVNPARPYGSAAIARHRLRRGSDLIDFSVNVKSGRPRRAPSPQLAKRFRIDAYPVNGIGFACLRLPASAFPKRRRLRRGVRHHLAALAAVAFVASSPNAEAASYYGACVQEFPPGGGRLHVPASFARAIEAGRRGVPLQSEQPDGRLRRPPRDRYRGLPLRAGGRAARRGRVFPRIARRPRKERGRTRCVFAPCGRALRVHQALRNGGVAAGISDQRKRPTHRGIRRAGQVFTGRHVGIAAPEDVEYVSRTRDVLAGERAGFPTSSPRSGFPSCRRMRTSFSPHAGDIPERLYKQGFWSARATRFRYCPVSGAVAVRTRKENARLAMAFSRALRAEGASGEGELTNGAAFAAALWRARMAEASAKEVDTRG